MLGKARNLRKTISAEGFEAKDVVYIGDEIRDKAAADAAGIDIIIVSWGYNSKDSLEKSNKSIIIDSPNELLDLLPSFEEI